MMPAPSRGYSTVTLEFGEVSGIVPDYLIDCWNWYAKKTPLIEGSELRCLTIPAVTWCNNCKKTYQTVRYGKTCPHCGSGETWLLRGNEINIKENVNSVQCVQLLGITGKKIGSD